MDKANQPALCIFDVFRAHQVEHNIRMRYVPTKRVTALKSLGHDEFKEVKNACIYWYAEQIQARLKLEEM